MNRHLWNSKHQKILWHILLISVKCVNYQTCVNSKTSLHTKTTQTLIFILDLKGNLDWIRLPCDLKWWWSASLCRCPHYEWEQCWRTGVPNCWFTAWCWPLAHLELSLRRGEWGRMCACTLKAAFVKVPHACTWNHPLSFPHPTATMAASTASTEPKRLEAAAIKDI